MPKITDSSDSSTSGGGSKTPPPLCALALAAPLSIQISDVGQRPAVVLSATSALLDRRWRHHRRPNRRRPRIRRREQEKQGADAATTGGSVRWKEQDAVGDSKVRWTLKQVLDTLQHVWQTPPSSHRLHGRTHSEEEEVQSRIVSNGMCDRFRKISCVSTSEISSPILLRRRLSAPETIMRKYVLAQRRTETQGTNEPSSMINLNTIHQLTSNSSSAITSVIGNSNPKLTKRRNDTMRKSTLIRRLWSNQPLLGGAYAEWQYSCGKVATRSTHSLGSDQFSPEHRKLSHSRRSLPDELRTSPKHISGSRRTSPSHQINRNYLNHVNSSVTSPKRKVSVYNGNYQDDNVTASMTSYTTPASNSSYMSTTNSNRSTRSNVDSTTKTNSIRNVSTSNSTTLITEKSDSAYSNSNYTITSNNEHFPSLKMPNEAKNETSTQTADTTNLNVISNIQLSEDTINLICNQVMHDVTNINAQSSGKMIGTVDGTLENTNTKRFTVQQTPSFYLNQDTTSSTPIKKFNDYSRIVKCMISNVEAGSSYKPAEVPQLIVPRYSALPRSTSMEVNTSSADSTDHEDTVSLVDSLEDHTSSRNEKQENTPKLTPPLPDNSDRVPQKNPTQKPTSFYVPIASTAENESNYKTMADNFPNRLREKISKRQKKCEEKRLLNKAKEFSPRSDSNYISASDNGNLIQYIVNSANSNNVSCVPEGNFKKSKKKPTALLPMIEPINRIKTGHSCNERVYPFEEKLLSTRKQYPKLENSHMKCKESPWLTRNRSKEKAGNVKFYSTDNVLHRQNRSDTNSNSKRIEIMEIMEFVESERPQGKKSKIPILVQHQKLPRLPHVNAEKPIYLDFDQVEIMDPKLDQLIANILIDTLHNPHFQSNVKECEAKKLGNINEKRPIDQLQSKFLNRYPQKFEAIPEEKLISDDIIAPAKCSNNNSFDDAAVDLLENRVLINNNVDVNETTRKDSNYQGKAAIADNTTSLPKGWITFYTLRKSQSPDSASDEGDQLMDIQTKQTSSSSIQHTNRDEHSHKHKNQTSPSAIKYTNNRRGYCKEDQNSSILKKTAAAQDIRLKNSSYQNRDEMDQTWSLTLSGCSSRGQLPPELEMRLKFPKFSQSRSKDFAATQESSISRRTQTSRSHIDFDNRLPDIMHKSRFYRNEFHDPNLGQSVDVLSRGMPTNPRPTKTSTKRYCLTHNTAAQLSQRIACNHGNVLRTNRQQFLLDNGNGRNMIGNRSITEMLRRFPDITGITGTNIVTERKPLEQPVQDNVFYDGNTER